MKNAPPRRYEGTGRGTRRNRIAAPYRMSGEQDKTVRFCLVYTSAWFAVCAICMSNTGTSATRQQMSKIPAQIARTETINLILLNMKNLSFGRKQKQHFQQSHHTSPSGHHHNSGEQMKTARTWGMKNGAAPFVAEPPRAVLVRADRLRRGCG